MTPPRRARRASRLAAAVALALPLLLAGCQGPKDRDDDPAGEAFAPAWQAGMQWNYTIHDPQGAATGWIRYRVVGQEDVDGHPTHRVEVTRRDAEDVDHDGVAGELQVHVENFDRASLRNRSPCPQVDGCVAELPVLDFPLWDGKSWDYWCCGDVQELFRADAQRGEDGTWRVAHRRFSDSPGNATRSLVYSPDAGFATRWEFSPQGRLEELWLLSQGPASTGDVSGAGSR